MRSKTKNFRPQIYNFFFKKTPNVCEFAHRVCEFAHISPFLEMLNCVSGLNFRELKVWHGICSYISAFLRKTGIWGAK